MLGAYIIGFIIFIIIVIKEERDIKRKQARLKDRTDNKRSPAVEKYYAEHAQMAAVRNEISDIKKTSKASAHKYQNDISSFWKTMDDRENDWLARQLREERRSAVYISAMLGLKKEHEVNCDAENLKKEFGNNI